MSCHVAIVVSILKNHSQKLFHFTKLFINILQASLLVLSRHYEATAEVIHFIWIASLTLAMTDIRNKVAMTKKILSLRGSGTPETSVAFSPQMRRLWRVIQNVCCAFLITMWLQPIVLTIQIEAHKGFAIGVPLGKPLVIRNWIASLTLAMTDIRNKVAMTGKIKIAHAVRHMAMTIFFAITKIFNSISFRDYSLLFIKKFINKGDFKMRNQTNNVFKVKRQKSKLFLIILCIFGLLFSYSCSCKNRVSNPDDTPNPDPDPYIPKTYEATRSGDTLILVSSDGASVTPASISFSNATVTSVSVDVGTTGINEAFKYENGGLTMTAFEGVTTTRQTVTATFNLAPNDSRDTLSNPTETVSIEVVKSKGTFDKKAAIGTTIKGVTSVMSPIVFVFSNEPEADKIVEK